MLSPIILHLLNENFVRNPLFLVCTMISFILLHCILVDIWSEAISSGDLLKRRWWSSQCYICSTTVVLLINEFILFYIVLDPYFACQLVSPSLIYDRTVKGWCSCWSSCLILVVRRGLATIQGLHLPCQVSPWAAKIGPCFNIPTWL